MPRSRITRATRLWFTHPRWPKRWPKRSAVLRGGTEGVVGLPHEADLLNQFPVRLAGSRSDAASYRVGLGPAARVGPAARQV